MHCSRTSTTHCSGRISCPISPFLHSPFRHACPPLPHMSPSPRTPLCHTCPPLPCIYPWPCMPLAMHAPGHACPRPCTSPGHARSPTMHAPGHACPRPCTLPSHACSPPPLNRMTDACENITLPQTLFAGGKYGQHSVGSF